MTGNDFGHQEPGKLPYVFVQTAIVKITFPDGSSKDYADGVSVADVAAEIGPRLARDALAGKVDDQLVDLNHKIDRDCSLTIVTKGSDEGLELLRHSTSHVMAQAVGRLFKNVRFGIGPAIDSGFYYDFDLDESLTTDDLERIEAEMRKIVAEDNAFVREELDRDEAIKQMEDAGQSYKVELMREIVEPRTSVYRDGDFVDWCRGPHAPSTGRLGHFKLTSVAGAYWRGSERNPMLQRIYGTAFATQKDLEEHLKRLEDAKKRDHRTLGKQLDLFSVHEEAGAGLIHWHPKGAMVRHIIETFWKSVHLKRGYDLVYTPHIASEKIYEISGHLENYAENMYSPMDIDGQPFRVKPMNCPGHIMIYKTAVRSYRDLPMRMAELGTVYRYERSGVLHGMTRVRGFTQDDSHIFCTRDQLRGEVEALLDLVDYMMRAFQYTYQVKLATRPEKSLGTDEEWEWSTGALRDAVEARGVDYAIDEGGGVFYAPKIDFLLFDALGRGWQGPTIQVDLNLPKRFDASYIGPDGGEHETVIVHRTVLGSMERFVGGLIEHFGGAFPVWLAPEQVRVLPITDGQNEYAGNVLETLRSREMRASADLRNEKIGHKIREATLERVPYMLVVGPREVSDHTVAARSRQCGDEGASPLDDFLDRVQNEIEERG